jgi:ABC-type sugar transport system substrate-binding protein
MRRYASAIAVTALLLASGFAAASIASGGGLRVLKKTGVGTTSTVPKKQTICHHTKSKKNPWVTITVSSNAVPAHLKHGDTTGTCTQSQLSAGKSKKGKKKSSSSSSGPGHGNGSGNGNGNGNGNGHGKKK